MLKTKFQTLCQNFTNDHNLVDTLWQEIEQRHTEPTRHYHTLQHLEQFYTELPRLDAVTEFAIFYHDIVYEVTRSDNEEQSALLCEGRLLGLGVEPELVAEVVQLIGESKTHEASSPRNTLFLDADLAVFGSTEKVYENYTHNVRREYAIYGDDVYSEGRQKVLRHFLAKERIYLSSYFYEKYEQKARKNLESELLSLSKGNS